jgi:4a-hydroxytetrahydrobiopterin dehydratase
MVRPTRLSPEEIDRWLREHPGWQRAESGAESLTRSFAFDDFASALGFVVRVGCAAEKRDHHPDVALGWGRATLVWTTHDAGGVTALDLELAAASERLASGAGAKPA